MKKIEHFNLPEHTNTLYQKEAISSISLTRDVADKINELVDAYNQLSTLDLQWKQEQEGTIRKGVLYMKDNLINSINELLQLLGSKFIDERVIVNLGNLQQQITNLLNSYEKGYTNRDGEVIDIRVGYDGYIDETAGSSVRRQLWNIYDTFISKIVNTVLSVEKGMYTVNDILLIDGYIKYENGVYIENSFDGVYMCTDFIDVPFFSKSATHNFTFSGGSDGYAFYDKKKIFISGGNGAINSIPENARYIRFTSYKTHDNKVVTFNIDTDSDAMNLSQLEEFANLLKTSLIDVTKGYSVCTPALVDGFVNYTTGALSNDSIDGYYKRTEMVLIPIGTYFINVPYTFSGGSDGYAFYTIDKEYISGGKELLINSIPENAVYIALSYYDNTFAHEEKEILFKVGARNVANNISLGTLVTFGDSHVARNGWQELVITNFNVDTHINLGIGSSTVAVNDNAEKLPFVDDSRIQAIKDANPDTIIIIGGTNDVHLDTPLGDNVQLSTALSSKDKTTFYGAYSFLIETLIEWKHTLKIVLCTTPQGIYDTSHVVKYADVSNAIVEIANFYSLPLVDIFGKTGINKVNFSTYSDDEIHLNSLGNARLANLIINTLKNSYIGG